jgi:hypothetical protein
MRQVDLLLLGGPGRLIKPAQSPGSGLCSIG